MKFELKDCLKTDASLREQYLKMRTNGASKKELNEIIDQIIQNKNKYNELITFNIDPSMTKKHKINKIKKPDYGPLTLNAILAGSFALLAVGTHFILKAIGASTDNDIILSTTPIAMGALSVKELIAVLIKKARYDKTANNIIEEIEKSEDGLTM